jgi:hypothetical protein
MKIESKYPAMLVIKTSKYPNNENIEQSYQNTWSQSIHMHDRLDIYFSKNQIQWARHHNTLTRIIGQDKHQIPLIYPN